MEKLLFSRSKRVGFSQRQANLMLMIITVAWGVSYIFLKLAMVEMTYFALIAMRFTIASAVVGLIFFKRISQSTLRDIACGGILGAWMFACISFLLFGMATTEASTAGFLTATAVVFVPVLQAIIKRRIPEPKIILGTVVTIIGIALLSLKNSMEFSGGAVLCLLGAFCYAVYIILTGVFTEKHDSIRLGFWNQCWLAIFGWIFTLLFEDTTFGHSLTAWLALLGLALICSAFAFVLQPVAQSFTTAEHTALIFSLEPAFAAIFAYLILGEMLTPRAYLGAVLIFASVIFTAMSKNHDD